MVRGLLAARRGRGGTRGTRPGRTACSRPTASRTGCSSRSRNSGVGSHTTFGSSSTTTTSSTGSRTMATRTGPDWKSFADGYRIVIVDEQRTVAHGGVPQRARRARHLPRRRCDGDRPPALEVRARYVARRRRPSDRRPSATPDPRSSRARAAAPSRVPVEERRVGARRPRIVEVEHGPRRTAAEHGHGVDAPPRGEVAPEAVVGDDRRASVGTSATASSAPRRAARSTYDSDAHRAATRRRVAPTVPPRPRSERRSRAQPRPRAHAEARRSARCRTPSHR